MRRLVLCSMVLLAFEATVCGWDETHPAAIGAVALGGELNRAPGVGDWIAVNEVAPGACCAKGHPTLYLVVWVDGACVRVSPDGKSRLTPALSPQGAQETLAEIRDPNVVISEMNSVQASHRHDADFFFRRGLLLQSLSRDSMARQEASIQDLTEALRLNPHLTAAYLERARSYLGLGIEARWAPCGNGDVAPLRECDGLEGLKNIPKPSLDRARSDLSEAIRRDPELIRAYRVRALASEAKGHHDEARQDLATILRLDPSCKEVDLAMKRVRNREQMEGSLEVATQALKSAEASQDIAREAADEAGRVKDLAEGLPATSMRFTPAEAAGLSRRAAQETEEGVNAAKSSQALIGKSLSDCPTDQAATKAHALAESATVAAGDAALSAEAAQTLAEFTRNLSLGLIRRATSEIAANARNLVAEAVNDAGSASGKAGEVARLADVADRLAMLVQGTEDVGMASRAIKAAQASLDGASARRREVAADSAAALDAARDASRKAASASAELAKAAQVAADESERRARRSAGFSSPESGAAGHALLAEENAKAASRQAQSAINSAQAAATETNPAKVKELAMKAQAAATAAQASAKAASGAADLADQAEEVRSRIEIARAKSEASRASSLKSARDAQGYPRPAQP